MFLTTTEGLNKLHKQEHENNILVKEHTFAFNNVSFYCSSIYVMIHVLYRCKCAQKIKQRNIYDMA